MEQNKAIAKTLKDFHSRVLSNNTLAKNIYANEITAVIDAAEILDKLPEGSVVLSKEEYRNLAPSTLVQYQWETIAEQAEEREQLYEKLSQADTEIANKIFTKLIEVAKNNDNKLSIGLLKAWAIEYGVEVK